MDTSLEQKVQNNKFRFCPHCVDRYGWPKGVNITKDDKARQKAWKENDMLEVEVMKTERKKKK